MPYHGRGMGFFSAGTRVESWVESLMVAKGLFDGERTPKVAAICDVDGTPRISRGKSTSAHLARSDRNEIILGSFRGVITEIWTQTH